MLINSWKDRLIPEGMIQNHENCNKRVTMKESPEKITQLKILLPGRKQNLKISRYELIKKI